MKKPARTQHPIVQLVVKKLGGLPNFNDPGKQFVRFKWTEWPTTSVTKVSAKSIHCLLKDYPDVLIKKSTGYRWSLNYIAIKVPLHYFDDFIPVPKMRYKTITCPHCEGTGKIRKELP